jgi:hypothetical protein
LFFSLNSSLLFLSSSLCFFSQAICFSVSTVPRCARASLYNAEINQRHQDGCHSESANSTSSPQVVPDSGAGEVSEEGEIGFIVKPQEGDADNQDGESGSG